MEKKEYKKPEIVVVPLPHKRLLLAGSPGINNSVTPKPSFARSIDWDDFDDMNVW